VNFVEEKSMYNVLDVGPHVIHQKQVEVKIAESKQETKNKAAADYKRTIIVTEIPKEFSQGKSPTQFSDLKIPSRFFLGSSEKLHTLSMWIILKRQKGMHSSNLRKLRPLNLYLAKESSK